MKKLLLIIVLLPFMAWSQIDINSIPVTYCALIVDDPQSLKEILRVDGDSSEIKYAGEVYRKETLFTEWQKYLKDCNKLVADTISQSGTVKCELIPVKMNGKIVSYNTVPIDTVWNPCDCEQYKDISSLIFRNNPLITSYGYLTTTGNYVLTSTGSHYDIPEPAKNIFSIKRDKICMIKKQKASFDDFFTRWCVEKKLIEFN